MRFSRLLQGVLILWLVLYALSQFNLPMSGAVGVANVVETNVFWGSDPTNPIAVYPGQVNAPLSVVITNVGDDVARNVNATLYTSWPILYPIYSYGIKSYAAAVSKFAGDMAAGQSFTANYIITVATNATQAIYRYPLQLTYTSSRELHQVTKTLFIDVPIYGGELNVQSVVTDPIKMFPESKEVLLRVSVANSGQTSVTDLPLRLELKPPFSRSSSGSDQMFIGNIPAMRAVEADFVIDVADNATPGQYSSLLVEDQEGYLTPIGSVPLLLSEKAVFQIVSFNPEVLYAGDSGVQLSIHLMNIGKDRADSVRVQLQFDNFFTSASTLTDFLGRIYPGQTKQATFILNVASDAKPGRYVANLRFDWTQADVPVTHTLHLALTVEPSRLPIYVAVGATIAVVAAAYLVMRRRRMRRVTT